MKQETLEEVAERLYPTDYGVKSKDIINIIKQDTFINGAKWQQERSYNEEGMKNAFTQGFNAIYKMLNGVESRNKFMEQFKKK